MSQRHPPVLDASALLALINSEPGAEGVAQALPDAYISAVNLSEVAGKLVHGWREGVPDMLRQQSFHVPSGGWPRGAPLLRITPDEIAAAGIERVGRIAGIKGGMPCAEDGRVLPVSTVVWCTGFRPDFGWIHLPVFDDQGYPLHVRGVVSDPGAGLYFAGLPFLHGFTSALVGGVGRDAEYVVDQAIKESSCHGSSTEVTRCHGKVYRTSQERSPAYARCAAFEVELVTHRRCERPR